MTGTRRERTKMSRVHKRTTTAAVFDSCRHFRLSGYSNISQTASCREPLLTEKFKAVKAAAFSMFAFHSCLFVAAVPADNLSGHLISSSWHLSGHFPNESRLFFLTRGWRLTCRTGWTRHALVTKGASTTMMKTPPSARVTRALTDMELMSTTTIINSGRTNTERTDVCGPGVFFLCPSRSDIFGDSLCFHL